MRFLAIVFLAAGIACVALVVHPREIPKPAPETDTEGAWTLTRLYFRARVLMAGVASLAVGAFCYDKSLARRSPIHEAAKATMMSGRICPKCGKVSRKSECAPQKHFGFIPRRRCPECGAYVERPAIWAVVAGAILLLWGLLGAFVFDGLPEVFLAPACIAAPLGFALLLVGIFSVERQFARVRKYAPKHHAPAPSESIRPKTQNGTNL
jgi:hypothetical protein